MEESQWDESDVLRTHDFFSLLNGRGARYFRREGYLVSAFFKQEESGRFYVYRHAISLFERTIIQANRAAPRTRGIDTILATLWGAEILRFNFYTPRYSGDKTGKEEGESEVIFQDDAGNRLLCEGAAEVFSEEKPIHFPLFKQSAPASGIKNRAFYFSGRDFRLKMVDFFGDFFEIAGLPGEANMPAILKLAREFHLRD